MRFVKVQDYHNWFLLIERVEDVPENLSKSMNEIMKAKVINDTLLAPTENHGLDFASRLIMVHEIKLDYKRIVKQYGPILIRPVGSYMTLLGHNIIQSVESDSFPVDQFSDIVICENDEKPEPEWVEFLQKKYPDKSIQTINFFKMRHEDEIKAYFSKAKFVTFSTTFSSTEWFDKLIKCLYPHNEVVGYCHDNKKWETVLPEYFDIEIIKDL